MLLAAAEALSELGYHTCKVGSDRILTLPELCELVAGRATLVIELKSNFDGDTRIASRAVEVLKAYQSQIHLAADPMNRWQADGEKFQGFLQSAKSINAENPRIYYLEGSSLFFTPEEYGGGKKVAKPMLEKAQQKFSAFKPETAIHPDWGKMETEWMLSQTN